MSQKNELGTIFDSNGNPLTPPASTKALPLEIQNHIETRINTAIDQLRENNRSDLSRIAEEKTRPWKTFSTILFILLLGWGFLNWLYLSPYKIQELVSEYVTTAVAEPAVKKTIQETSEKLAEQLVAKEIKPIEVKASELTGRINEMSMAIEQQQKAITEEQALLTKKVQLQELAVAVKGGDSQALKTLHEIKKSDSNLSVVAATYLRDIDQFYTADRHSLIQRILINKKGGKNTPPIEELIELLKSNEKDVRHAAIDELSDRKVISTTGILCETLRNEKDLVVVSRITRALEKITGEKIAPLDNELALAWWDKNKTNPKFQLPNNWDSGRQKIVIKEIATPRIGLDFRGVISIESAKEAIPLLKVTLSAEPKLDFTRLWLILCLLESGNTNEAQSELGKYSTDHRNYCAPLAEAAVACKLDQQEKAIKLINESLSLYSESSRIIQGLALFSQAGSSPNIEWPQK